METALQPPEHRRRRQGLDAGRRKLDGQRKPVEPVADLGDGARVLARQGEVGLGRHRPLHEQHDRRIACQRVERGRASGIGAGQRWDRHLVLAVEMQRLPAGDENLEGRFNREKVRHKWHRAEQVFEAVEKQQRRRSNPRRGSGTP